MPDIHDEDLSYWQTWDASGRRSPQLQPLISRFEGTVNQHLNKYKRQGNLPGNLPEAAVKAELQNNLVDAFETYDPKMGVKLNTYANHHLMKTKRFVASYQNVARIPEPVTNRIGEYRRMEESLSMKLSRPPTVFEMANELKWPVKHVEVMQKSLRKDLSPNVFTVDPVALQTSRTAEVITLLPYELNSQEKAVFELLVKNPDTPMSKVDIASRLHISPSRVSKISKSITGKMKGHLYG